MSCIGGYHPSGSSRLHGNDLSQHRHRYHSTQNVVALAPRPNISSSRAIRWPSIAPSSRRTVALGSFLITKKEKSIVLIQDAYIRNVLVTTPYLFTMVRMKRFGMSSTTTHGDGLAEIPYLTKTFSRSPYGERDRTSSCFHASLTSASTRNKDRRASAPAPIIPKRIAPAQNPGLFGPKPTARAHHSA